MNRTTLLALLLISAPVFADPAPPAPPTARPFSHPDRIRYDSHCLTIDGKDLFVFSGSFHYFRCPKELWPDRMARLKAMGLNTVETYVAWDVQEPEKPASLDDFSKVNLTDLDDFITLAEKNGLYVIIRPGPYICAEWDDGGFPRWLLSMRPASVEPGTWLRGDDPVFMDWSRHWLKAVCPVIAKHQITRKAPGEPGVILFQLENEYDYSSQPAEAKTKYLKVLAQEAQADGIDVPLFTCWTREIRGSIDPVLRGVFDSCNFYPRWNVDGELNTKMQALRSEQPDAPMMTTELQGGWFTNVGGKPESDPDKVMYGVGCTPAQINNLTLLAIQNGDAITNYYMAFGGTNFGDWAARNIATSYDYTCPIRECGGVDDKYLRVQAIGQMLQEHGPSLARSDPVALTVANAPTEVSIAERRGSDGSSYFFVRTPQHDLAKQGTATVTEIEGDNRTLSIPVDLEPFGSKVLWLPPGVNDPSKGEWLPKPTAPIARPDHVPAVVPIQTAVWKADDGPADATAYSTTDGIPDAGVNDSRYLFYKLSFDLVKTAALANPQLTLSVIHPDSVMIESGGKIFAPNIVGTHSVRFFDPSLLTVGHNEMTLLYECAGHANGGDSMEDPAQITGVSIGSGPVPTPIDGWKMQTITLKGKPTKRSEVAAKFDDSAWAAADVSNANQLKKGESAVFRATVDLSKLPAGTTDLDFGQLNGQSWVYINGKQVLTQDDATMEANVAVPKALQGKTFLLAVIVTADADTGGMARPGLLQDQAPSADSIPFKLAVATDSVGRAGQWFKSDLDDSAWKGEAIGEAVPAAEGASTDPAPLLTWHRLKFSLPPQDPHIWVPWCARLDMTGNAFLYLNGHPLGRYWRVGPQHDFYMPECWLNFGPGQQNVLTICMRPVKGAALIQDAEVRPYSAYAEVR